MQFMIEQRSSAVIVRPEGPDLIGCEKVRLHEAIRAALSRPAMRRLIIDFSQVRIVDSACLGVLVTAHSDTIKSHRTMCLAVLPQGLIHTLVITRLDTIFTIAQTVEGAIAFKT